MLPDLLWDRQMSLGRGGLPSDLAHMPYRPLKVITSILNYTQKETGSQGNLCNTGAICTN